MVASVNYVTPRAVPVFPAQLSEGELVTHATMIPKPLDQILGSDLDSLIADEVREGKTIDYKQTVPGSADSDKKEFLGDVSSFANTVGGDLVFGVVESAGTPTHVVGITVPDIDGEIQRLDNIVKAGLAPRIRHHIRAVKYSDQATVLLLRVERSWIGPHRVIFKEHDKFYARNSAGKYPMDVTELRSAFLLTGSLPDRIRGFREDRLLEIQAGRTPIALPEGGKVVMHALPLESFTSSLQLDVGALYHDFVQIRPIGSSGLSRRINLDGLVTYSGGSPAASYAQLYRSGMIETVSASIVGERQGRRFLPSIAFEDVLIKSLNDYLRLFPTLGVAPPIYVFLSFVGVKGVWMGAGTDFFNEDENHYPIDKEVIALSEVVVNDYTEDAAALLRPALNLVWNACGYSKSPNFDQVGKWNPTR
jgi:hypothetical protein